MFKVEYYPDEFVPNQDGSACFTELVSVEVPVDDVELAKKMIASAKNEDVMWVEGSGFSFGLWNGQYCMGEKYIIWNFTDGVEITDTLDRLSTLMRSRNTKLMNDERETVGKIDRVHYLDSNEPEFYLRIEYTKV